MKENCKYPIILVHGMFGWGENEGINKKLPYWGATSMNLVDYLKNNGNECFAASVGPISSAWDRACELYAQLTGTRVDYGKVHSEKYNHRRFGRNYEKPLFENWGEKNKIHLIGHSFGGNTVRLFVHLMTYGSQEEIDGTSDEDLSPFFKGGKECFIKSVMTICAPHNGTVAFEIAQKYKIISALEFLVYNYIGIAGRTPINGRFVDFHLEQFGLTDTPGFKDADPFFKSKKSIKYSEDNIEFDMSPEGAERLNKSISISENIYYFSFIYNCLNIDVMKPKNTDFPFLKATSSLILFDLSSKSQKAGINSILNDGLVDVSSATKPANEPFTKYDSDNLHPGIWNIMPIQAGDHGTPIGLLNDKQKFKELYQHIIEILKQTEGNQSND